MEITNAFGSPYRDQSPRTPDRKIATQCADTIKNVRFAKDRSPITARATYLPLTWGETPTSFLSPVTISAVVPALISTPTKSSVASKQIKSISVKRHKTKQPISSFQAPPLVLPFAVDKNAESDWDWQAPSATQSLSSLAIDFGENVGVVLASSTPSVRPSPFSILQSLHRWHSSTNTPRPNTFTFAPPRRPNEGMAALSCLEPQLRPVECLVGTIDRDIRCNSALIYSSNRSELNGRTESSMEEGIEISVKDEKQKRKRSRVSSSSVCENQSTRRSARLL